MMNAHRRVSLIGFFNTLRQGEEGGGSPPFFSRSAPCPAATRAADLGRCPGVDTGGGGMVGVGMGGFRVTP